MGESDEILFVLGGDETGGDLVEAPAGEHNQAGVQDERDGALANDAAHATGIFDPEPFEGAIERTEEPAENPIHASRKPIARLVMAFQQHGAECRRKGQRIDRGDDGGNRDRDGELLIELAGQTADECGRNEYGR